MREELAEEKWSSLQQQQQEEAMMVSVAVLSTATATTTRRRRSLLVQHRRTTTRFFFHGIFVLLFACCWMTLLHLNNNNDNRIQYSGGLVGVQAAVTITPVEEEEEEEGRAADFVEGGEQASQQQESHQHQKQDKSSSSSSWLLLCTADGSLYGVDAMTGQYRTKITTPSLLKRASAATTSTSTTSSPGDTNGIVLPGLDGRLYWQQPLDESEPGEGGENGDDNTAATEPWQALPLTIQSLLEHPVQSCGGGSGEDDDAEDDSEDNDDDDCGILSATVETSLLALDGFKGKMQWETISRLRSQGGGTEKVYYETTTSEEAETEDSEETEEQQSDPNSNNKGGAASPDNKNNMLLLQRKDYRIQQVSKATGLPSWNVTLGTWQALEFSDDDLMDDNDDDDQNDDDERDAKYEDYDGQDDYGLIHHSGDEDHYPPPQAHTSHHRHHVDNLPAIVFLHGGRTLLAVDPLDLKIHWKVEMNSVIASVFGIRHGKWKTLLVVNEHDLDDEDEDNANMLSLPAESSDEQHHQGLLQDASATAAAAAAAAAEEAMHDLLWRQRQTTEASPLWWYNQQQQQQQQQQNQQRSNNKQRALPSRPPTPPQCQAGSTDNDGEECKNVLYPSYLGMLPGPPAAPPSLAAAGAAEVVGGGIFITWKTITVVVALWIVGIAGARRFYLFKKRSWLQEQQQQQQQSTSASSIHHSGTDNKSNGINEDQMITRSLSLEGFGDDSDDDDDDEAGGGGGLARPLPRCQSLPDTHSLLLASKQQRERQSYNNPSTPTTAELATPSEHNNATNTTNNIATIPPPAPIPAMTSLGGIPLVRYSRYASEFEEVAALGEGGFGTVFECRNVLDGRGYAVKKVTLIQRTNLLQDGNNSNAERKFQQRLERVLREVKSLAVLDHPHIVRYYTAWLELEKEDPEDSEKRRKAAAAASLSTARNNGKDDSTWSSQQCYSSSLVTESSISQWGQHQSRTSNSRFWNNKTSVSVSSSSARLPAPYYRRARSLNVDGEDTDDCGFIFEEASSDLQEQKVEEGEDERKESAQESVRNTSTGSTATEKRATAAASSARNSSVLPSNNSSITDRSSPTSTLESLSKKNKKVSCDEFDGSVLERIASKKNVINDTNNTDKSKQKPVIHRHTLYIQMQLCSQKTLQDFLSSRDELDVVRSLNLFLQVAQAVEHVHEQGLIHRDLKPCNIFLVDGNDYCKVGDFGLSRESTTESNASSKEDEEDEDHTCHPHDIPEGGDDHTAGVGTRSYASPEQMNGSDYDSSTDVFSLGIILFELCYRMATVMERNICLSRLRQSTFPDDWDASVGTAFPSLRGLIRSMLSLDPSDRPTASSVARHVQSLFQQFTILDEKRWNRGGRNDVLLLRVEAEHRHDALGRTLQAIQEASASLSPPSTLDSPEKKQQQGPAQVLQYGLCSSDDDAVCQNQRAIMEFALKFEGSGVELVDKLLQRPEIYKVRQVHTRSNSHG